MQLTCTEPHFAYTATIFKNTNGADALLTSPRNVHSHTTCHVFPVESQAAPLGILSTLRKTPPIRKQQPTIQFEHPSPPYIKDAGRIPTDANEIFQLITTKATRLEKFGIKGAFDVLRQRHFEVYIDSGHTLKPETYTALHHLARTLLRMQKQQNAT